jgi:hypothetical protein
LTDEVLGDALSGATGGRAPSRRFVVKFVMILQATNFMVELLMQAGFHRIIGLADALAQMGRAFGEFRCIDALRNVRGQPRLVGLSGGGLGFDDFDVLHGFWSQRAAGRRLRGSAATSLSGAF